MLTNAALRAAAPAARAYKLFDSLGLHLFIAPSGLRAWRLKYRKAGREQLLTLGRYPEMSLAEARAMRDIVREQIAAGAAPRIDAGGATFARVARAWYAHNVDQWSATHAADVLATIERDVLPAIGEMPIGAITAPELGELLRAIEARGAINTARRVRVRLSMIFRYALAGGLATSDPAAALGAVLRRPRPARPQPALGTLAECRALLAACDAAGAPPATLLASRFLALTAVRLDAVRGMQWSEIEDLDGAAPLWIVPAARMKLAKAKKDLKSFDHLVPLSPQAVAVLRAAANLQPAAADLQSGLVFPGAGNQRIGEGAIRHLYGRAGYAGRHVPHGWRSSFSTIMNETLAAEAAEGLPWRTVIDMALAHVAMGKVEGAYNRAQLLDQRRQLFRRWGEMLAA